MDFVVFGFGLGAILMLAGFALRDLGPWLFGSPRDDAALPEFESVKSTIRKQTLSSIGNAISVAGAGVAVVTFSALLARTQDDTGAIVVGMSLVLAAVGVGAWSYDIFRRYRAAMDIVSAQEAAARTRLTPRPKKRKARPQPVEPVVTGVVNETQPSTAVEFPQAAESEEAITPPDLGEHDLDQPLPDWHGVVEEPVASSNAGTETTGTESADGSRDAAAGASEPPAEMAVVAPVTPSFIQQPEAPTVFPVEPEDALIDEAVKVETPADARRSLPSWLFDDLETDLANHGARNSADAIDHFKEAKPYQRGSALDRLLAGDDGEDDGDASVEQQVPRINKRTNQGER